MAIAPEGTRSWSPEVGPFKKGAFHMARQAGVPVVPMVIRNAGEVMGATTRRCARHRPGRGAAAGRRQDWPLEEMDERVAAVRQQFVDTLENWPAAAKEAHHEPVRSGVAVLGAGSWGTTVASLAARNAETVVWRARRGRASRSAGSTATAPT